MAKLPKILLLVGSVLLVLNLAYVDYLLIFKKPIKPASQQLVSPVTQTETSPTPGQKPNSSTCQTPAETKTTPICSLPTSTKTPATSSPQTTYVPLGGGGSSTINTTWTSLPGSEFVFDPANYPARAKVYWEGNLKVSDPGSRCYARLYDTTNFRAVDFSEQSTDKTAFDNLTSQPLAIWTGNNHYRLEIKSLNGFTCSLDSPKLIVKY